MDRRDFLKIAGAGIAASAVAPGFLPGSAFAGSAGGTQRPRLHLFSKVLQFLDYRELAESVAALGFDGVDLTVRSGGHVEPEHFERDLPLAVNAMKEAGLNCEMIVTKIVDAGNQRDFDMLALAQSLGVRSYRLGGLKYEKDTPPMVMVERYTEQLAALAEWNREIGITGMYQNHSGEGHFGASAWDIYLAVRDLDPNELGIQFDIRHAVTEGGRKWPDSVRLLQPHTRSLAFKDFIWAEVEGQWKLVNTPIGEGMVDFSRYFGMLKAAKTDLPVSIHCEYDLGGAEKGIREPAMPKEQILAAIRRDVAATEKLWDGA